VQHAQQHFLQLLTEKPPALMIVMTDFTRPHGSGTISEIPGLKAFVHSHYTPIRQAETYTIWKHNTLVSPAGLPSVQTPAPHSAPASPP
jgi:hypothetical protein